LEMCLAVAPTGILGTAVTWADLEKHLRAAFGTDARFGANKSVVDIGDGNGFASCCGLINCDWVGIAAEEKLPKTVVLKIPTAQALRKLNDAAPEGQRMFNYTEEQWAEMEAKFFNIHNTEVASYDFLDEFEGLAMPRKYYGRAVEEENKAEGQLCLEYMDNSRMMSFYEKHTVEQVRQIARALGKIQACSLKKDVTAPALQKNFFENIANMWPLETYHGMFKGVLTVDSCDETKELMKKIDALLDTYHGSTLPSTIHTQHGFRPVLVNGDMHTGNVLIDQDTGDLAALIDWQCTHLGVGVEDLHRIALTALTAEERRLHTPMLVEEMYKSMVEHLDGAEPPYSQEKLLVLSDILYPHCALFFASVFASFIAKNDKDPSISDEEKATRKEVTLNKLIGSLEDVLTIDITNKKHIGNLKFKE
ncbi:hypothetical protein PENTCL1PPCAC_14515, partial [Pristionchus entomophagus]